MKIIMDPDDSSFNYKHIGPSGGGGSYSTAFPYAGVSGPLGSTPNVTITNGGTAVPNYNISYSQFSTSYKESNLKVDGDIEFNGKSLSKLLDTIEKRLAILTPDPKKLKQFEALQKAYENYKVLEALCQIPEKDDDTK